MIEGSNFKLLWSEKGFFFLLFFSLRNFLEKYLCGIREKTEQNAILRNSIVIIGLS